MVGKNCVAIARCALVHLPVPSLLFHVKRTPLALSVPIGRVKLVVCHRLPIFITLSHYPSPPTSSIHTTPPNPCDDNSDLRYGVQAQTVGCNFPKVYKMSDRLFVGLSGLATDVQTLEQLLRFRLNMYKLREERDIKPETFSALLSHILYEKRCALVSCCGLAWGGRLGVCGGRRPNSLCALCSPLGSPQPLLPPKHTPQPQLQLRPLLRGAAGGGAEGGQHALHLGHGPHRRACLCQGQSLAHPGLVVESGCVYMVVCESGKGATVGPVEMMALTLALRDQPTNEPTNLPHSMMMTTSPSPFPPPQN